MFRPLFWHELRLMRRNAVFWIVFAVLLAAIAGALELGHQRSSAATETARALASAAVALPDGLARGAPADTPPAASHGLPAWGPRHPDYVANERGAMAWLPPAPLLKFAAGQSDVRPDHVRITARQQQSVMAADQVENPLALYTGVFDLAFVILFLYPLLILAVTFDLTASERDSGTLRLLLAQPVTLRTVVLAKVAVRAALLLLPPLVIPLLLVIGGDLSLARILIWSACVLAYGLFWFGLAIRVNSRGRSAVANALVLASAWLGFVIVLPTSVNLFVDVLQPVPSRVVFANAVREATREAVVEGSRVLSHFLEDHPTASSIGRDGLQQFALLQAARDAEVARLLAPLVERHEARLEAQRRLVSRLRYLSPTMLAQGAMLDSAGTSGARYRHFLADAGRFQAAWQAYFQPKILAVEPLTADDYAAMPRYRPDDEPAGDVIGRTAVPVALMALVGSGLSLLGIAAYRRYTLVPA